MGKNSIRIITSSNLGSLLFDIFVCDMLFIMKSTYFTVHADDNKPLVVRVYAKGP